MKEIKATERFKIRVIPQNYQLIEFVKGGKEVRNPSTGENVVTEDKWQAREVYYSDIKHMVCHIAKLEADSEAKELNEWLTTYAKVADDIHTNWIMQTGC